MLIRILQNTGSNSDSLIKGNDLNKIKKNAKIILEKN